MKSVDVHPFAEAFVHKSLLADKLFVENPHLLQAPPSMDGIADDGITKNLVGRLKSATTVKSAMTTAINAIHRAAGMEVPYERSIPPRKQQKHTTKDTDQPRISITPAPRDTDNSRISITPASRSTSRQPTHSPGFIRSDAPVPESDDDHEGFNLELSTIKSSSASPEPPKRSTFLPALSTGYIQASDSSDPDEEYNSFAPLKKERKNRRGQQARQAIWLKKYGKNARHLHPELKIPPPKEAKPTTTRENNSTSVDASNIVTGVVEKKVNDPHPSWIAKQKQREQQKTMMSSIKPQKIVFD